MDNPTGPSLIRTALAGYFANMNPIAITPIFTSRKGGDDAATLDRGRGH